LPFRCSVFSGTGIAQCFVFYVVFVNHCLPFCPFPYCHCILCVFSLLSLYSVRLFLIAIVFCLSFSLLSLYYVRLFLIVIVFCPSFPYCHCILSIFSLLPFYSVRLFLIAIVFCPSFPYCHCILSVFSLLSLYSVRL
jgi:hypothetical protein